MHVFSPYIQGPIPSGIGPCFFTAGKKDKSKRIIHETQAENALLLSGNLLDIMDNLHGSYLRHSSEKTLK